PAIRQDRQRRAVGPARHPCGQTWVRLERAEACHGRLEGGGQLRLRPAYRQPALWVVAATCWRRSARGCGNSWCSRFRVSHAARFSLIAVRELARPTSASWACDPLRERL